MSMSWKPKQYKVKNAWFSKWSYNIWHTDLISCGCNDISYRDIHIKDYSDLSWKMYIWDSICLNQEGIVIEHIFLQYRSLKLYTHNLSRLNYLEAVKFRTSSKFNYWKAIYWHIIYQYENVCFQINNNFHYILYVQLLQHFRYMITNVWIYHNTHSIVQS